MTLKVIQERINILAIIKLKQKFRKIRVKPDFFEFPKRDRSLVKKKATVLSTISLILDSLILV